MIDRQWMLDRLEELRVQMREDANWGAIPADAADDFILDLMDRVAGNVSPHARAPGVPFDSQRFAAIQEAVLHGTKDDLAALLISTTGTAAEHIRAREIAADAAASTRAVEADPALAARILDRGDSAEYVDLPRPEFDEADNMCPNCVTPWKCNGPHIPRPA